MGNSVREQLRTGFRLAGGVEAASDFRMVSGESPQTGTEPTKSGHAGSVTTVPFEVVRRAEFVFEPFMGSLIQLPELKVQEAQNSEFFLPQSPPMAGAEEKSLAGVDLEKTAERESEKAEEGLRFVEPEQARFVDPVVLVPKEDRAETALPSQEEAGQRSSIKRHEQLKAAIRQIDEQGKRHEKKKKPTEEKKRGLKAPIEKSAEVQETADDAPGPDVAAPRRTAGWEEVAAPEAPASESVADPTQSKEAEFARAPALPAEAAKVDERALWEVELAEALLARTQVVEKEETPKKKEKQSLASRLRKWITGEVVSLDGNRRRAERMVLPGLIAFYWSGGTPRPHEIVNISRTGFYLRTNEFWSVETLVRMTLVRPPADKKQKGAAISVLARVVRIDGDGVGHEFVTTKALMQSRSLDVMPSQGTDWRELDTFLGWLIRDGRGQIKRTGKAAELMCREWRCARELCNGAGRTIECDGALSPHEFVDAPADAGGSFPSSSSGCLGRIGQQPAQAQ